MEWPCGDIWPLMNRHYKVHQYYHILFILPNVPCALCKCLPVAIVNVYVEIFIQVFHLSLPIFLSLSVSTVLFAIPHLHPQLITFSVNILWCKHIYVASVWWVASLLTPLGMSETINGQCPPSPMWQSWKYHRILLSLLFPQ